MHVKNIEKIPGLSDKVIFRIQKSQVVEKIKVHLLGGFVGNRGKAIDHSHFWPL